MCYGSEFVKGAARLLEDVQALFKRGSERKDPFTGRLRIGVGPAALEWYLIEPLADLLRQHPTIRYDVSSSSFESVVQQLRSGSIDVAVGFQAAFSQWPDLRCISMGELQTALFVRKGHPLLEETSVSIENLADFDFVAPTESRPYGEIVRNFYESRGIDWRLRVHHTDYFPIARRIVAMSDAISVTSLTYAQSEEFKAHFAALTGLNPWPSSPLCCAVRVRWEPKPAARAFISIVRKSLPQGHN